MRSAEEVRASYIKIRQKIFFDNKARALAPGARDVCVPGFGKCRLTRLLKNARDAVDDARLALTESLSADAGLSASGSRVLFDVVDDTTGAF